MILLEITNDPKKLEFSNARIDGPAETFYHLNKLIDSVKELEKELREGEYDYYQVIAELLSEVHEQMKEFKQYSAIQHVEQIFKKVDAIETELKRQIQWCFREIGSLTSSERYDHEQDPEHHNEVWNVDVSSISQAYLVVDVLGDKFRKDLLERFAQLQLISYEKLFQYGTKYCSLDHLEQRFIWFKYLLHLVESKLHDVLPSKWQVTYHLYTEFARRTQKHLHDVLTEVEKETVVLHDQEHVAMILKALKSVVAFEAEITASFIAKERFDAGESGEIVLKESIRDAFDPFLSGYVYMERLGLEQLMKEMLRDEESLMSTATMAAAGGAKAGQGKNNNNGNNNDDNDETRPRAVTLLPNEPYESSRKMFEYIKSSLKRCTGFSTGITYLSLSKEFRICLHQYSESLKFRCPSPAVAARNGKPPVYQITKAIEQTLCRILTTCEYCIDTIPALENMMKLKIKNEFKSEVDFQAQIDVYNDLIKYTQTILCLGEINRMEIDFQAMRKIDWSRFDEVGDVGGYIKHELKILSDCIPRIRLTMSVPYFINFCINFANLYLDAFLDTIWMLKRISKTGAGQLLLDLNGIKEYLMTMPNVRLTDGKTSIPVGKAYSFAVGNKIKHIENILKLICTEDNMMDEMFSVLWPEATKEETDQILILKGSKLAMPNIPMPPIQVDPNFKKGVDNIKEGTNKALDGMKNQFTRFTSAVGDLFNDPNASSSHSHDDARTEKSGSSTHGSNHGINFKTLGAVVSGFGGGSSASGAGKGGSNSSHPPTGQMKKPGSGNNLTSPAPKKY